MDKCIFCKIINKEIKSELLYEDENVIAINDINPQSPIHILIIPKKHIESMNEIENTKIIAEIFNTVKKLTKDKNIKEYRIVLNTGKEAGQEVLHMHFHLMSGRKFNWPAG